MNARVPSPDAARRPGPAPPRPRALVTRPAPEDPICRALNRAGFDVVPAALTVTLPAPPATRAAALATLRDTAWVALTSPTAARVLGDTAREAGTTLAQAVSGLRVAAVGRGTARALAAAGVAVDLQPAPHAENAAGLATAFPDPPAPAPAPGHLRAELDTPLRPPIRPDGPPAGPLGGPLGGPTVSDATVLRVAEPARHVVLPTSMLAAPTLAQGLRARGWEVTSTPLYTTAPVRGEAADEARARVLGAGDWPDVVVLTAGSGARALVEVLGRPPAGVGVAVIGEPTAAVCAEVGIRVDAVAATPAPADLAAAARAALRE